MKVFINTLKDGTITLDVNAYDIIDNVKAQIYEARGIPPSQQQLRFAGQQLQGARTIAECNIKHDWPPRVGTANQGHPVKGEAV